MQLARARMGVLNSGFQEGSNNIKKPMKINAAHKRKAGIRNDFLHQTSKLQAKKHELVVIEDLKIKNMSKPVPGSIDNSC